MNAIMVSLLSERNDWSRYLFLSNFEVVRIKAANSEARKTSNVQCDRHISTYKIRIQWKYMYPYIMEHIL